jgi:hypothetical protein
MRKNDSKRAPKSAPFRFLLASDEHEHRHAQRRARRVVDQQEALVGHEPQEARFRLMVPAKPSSTTKYAPKRTRNGM